MFSLSSRKQKKGQGLVEYALVIVLVSIVVIAALTILGPQVSNVFNKVSGTLESVAAGGGGAGGGGGGVNPPVVPASCPLTGYTFVSYVGGGGWTTCQALVPQGCHATVNTQGDCFAY